jgi:small subunit ribosomal protein S9
VSATTTAAAQTAARDYFYGTGRRKTAVARVRLVPGNGAVVINGKPMDQVYSSETHRQMIVRPLRLTATFDQFSVMAVVEGGGIYGQAGAIRHGISRALAQFNTELRPVLRKEGLLTRDPRVKERKKFGLKRARRAPQYTKR